MGSKKKKHQIKTPASTNQPLDPGDDPYWRISPDPENPEKAARYIERFSRLTFHYPQWIDDTGGGVPSYYAVLNVLRGASAEDLRRSYERECNISAYPDDTIEEAYRVLSDLQLRIQYDEFLLLFQKISIATPLDIRKELLKVHDSFLENARHIRRLQGIKEDYSDYIILVSTGMPNIFAYSGLDEKCSEKEIIEYAQGGDRLSEMIASICRDPVQRDSFIFIHDFVAKNTNPDLKEELIELNQFWKTLDRELIRKVLLTSLTASEEISDTINRIGSLLSVNHDWIRYLPPAEKNFLSIFGLDEDIKSLSKGEIESLLRTKYRSLEKTTEVNLAYSVLKKENHREDYFWLLEHHELHVISRVFHGQTEKTEKGEEEESIQKILKALRRMKRDADLSL
ncbi:MAG: hypothetical protein JXA44_14005 [Methanospirillaceae archaeon]|nr:hypothetical protein [Methanospirillaceae archaeon]